MKVDQWVLGKRVLNLPVVIFGDHIEAIRGFLRFSILQWEQMVFKASCKPKDDCDAKYLLYHYLRYAKFPPWI